jgi:drug/metabolite transporter (DMT)-like permease
MEGQKAGVDRGALVLMVATILMWAGSWIFMKMIVPYLGPFDFVVLRYVSGGLLLLALAVVMRRPLRVPSWKLTLLVGLTQTAAFQGLVQTALVHGGVGKISLMAYTMPFWVVILSWLILGERPTRMHWMGIGIAAVGLICVIDPWHSLGETVSVLLALGSGLSWGVGTVLAKKAFNRERPDILSFTGWQMLAGGVAMIPVAWAVPQIAPVWNPSLILGMLYIVVVASAAGWVLWLLVVQRVPASVAGISALGTPVVAAMLAWLFLNEHPTPIEGAGMALILCGLLVVARAASRPQAKTHTTNPQAGLQRKQR